MTAALTQCLVPTSNMQTRILVGQNLMQCSKIRIRKLDTKSSWPQFAMAAFLTPATRRCTTIMHAHKLEDASSSAVVCPFSRRGLESSVVDKQLCASLHQTAVATDPLHCRPLYMSLCVSIATESHLAPHSIRYRQCKPLKTSLTRRERRPVTWAYLSQLPRCRTTCIAQAERQDRVLRRYALVQSVLEAATTSCALDENMLLEVPTDNTRSMQPVCKPRSCHFGSRRNRLSVGSTAAA